MNLRMGLLLSFVLALAVAAQAQSKGGRATVVYDDAATTLDSAREDAGQLWLATADLQRATGFEIKPQGVCRDALCVPLPKERRQQFLRKDAGKTWFNLSAFAALVQQPLARDTALSTWYFGLRADQRQTLASLEAPDFTLPDLQGRMHSLHDFRGKKVFLITWASW